MSTRTPAIPTRPAPALPLLQRKKTLGPQPRLAISTPGDTWEREADLAADKVLSAGGRPLLSRLPSAPLQRDGDDEAKKKPPSPVTDGLSLVASNLGENNPAFSKFTERLGDRFMAQPAPLSLGVPMFLGANYAFLWSMALANPAMRRQFDDFNLAMLPGIVPQFPIKTFKYQILDGKQTRFGFEIGLDASKLMEAFNQGVLNTRISSLKFDTAGKLDTAGPRPLSLSALQVQMGLFGDGLQLSGGFRNGISPYPLQQPGGSGGNTSLVMAQSPALPDLYANQRDVRFMVLLDVPKLIQYFQPSAPAGPEALQRAPADGAAAQTPAAGDAVQATLAGTGAPLDQATRGFMEGRFGHDFGRVRVHADGAAAASARAVQARAYTVGQDIVFAAGQYAPASSAGRRLLAHELAHVVQQAGTGISSVVQRQPDGGPPENRALRDGVPYEKWSEQVESLYRQAGDDPRANAVARCRAQGKDACAWLLTPGEVDALMALADESHGDESKIRAGLPKVIPLLSLAGPIGPLSRAPAVVVPGLAGSAGTGTATGTGAAAGASAAAAAAAVTVVAVVAIAGYQLWKLGRFQQALRDKGFIILEDPLAQSICHSCHTGPARVAPLPRTLEDWPPLTGPRWPTPIDANRMRDFLGPPPGTGATTAPTPTVDAQPQADPQPVPQTQTRQRRRSSACPYPTGLTPADPIPIAWHKIPSLYPSPIQLNGFDYHRETPRTLPHGEPIGVPARFWPRIGKLVQLVPDRRGPAAEDFRATLASYGFDWGAPRFLQADHVQDLQWGALDGENLDSFRNLWPYDGAANASAGPSQNQHQPVSFCETKAGPPHVNVPIQHVKRPGGWGRYFIVSRLVP